MLLSDLDLSWHPPPLCEAGGQHGWLAPKMANLAALAGGGGMLFGTIYTADVSFSIHTYFMKPGNHEYLCCEIFKLISYFNEGV